MFVQAAMEAALAANVLSVPRSAVMDTGKEKVVYVAKGNGVFEKRSVEASSAGDEFYAVTRGLDTGERVVTNGNFLIDSQTRLTGTIAGMFGGSKAFGEQSSEGTPSDHASATVTLQSEPTPPKGGADATFHVKVIGPDGKPVSDAQVRMTLVMPAMPAMGMPESRSAIELAWHGSEYVGKGTVAMAGAWNVTVEARRQGQLIGVYRSRLEAK
jgi:Cu(I)/Ag(I) efflux system membrane fusion protein